MPKTPADYIHCIRCHVPMENPILRRVETEVWYMEFAACEDCVREMLAMKRPSVTMEIDGACLKTLLKADNNCFMQASVFKG